MGSCIPLEYMVGTSSAYVAGLLQLGPEPHLEEMEEALSILASELVRLEEAKVQCGLSLSQGDEGAAVNLFNAGATEELLCALAAYHPMKLKLDAESNKVIAQPSIFHEGPIYEAAQRVGRFYYIAYDTSRLGESKLLRRLDRTCTSILTYLEPEPYLHYTDAEWVQYFTHHISDYYAPNGHMDYGVIYPLAQKAADGSWQQSKLEAVKKYLLKQL